VENAEDVTVLWEEIKAREKKGQERKSALDGVPKALPALQFAQKMQKKAAKVGFDWPDTGEGSLEKMEEEIREIREEMGQPGRAEELEEELGDFLFATVNFIRKRKFDAESLLRRATLKFESRFRQVEGLAEARGLDWDKLSLEEMEGLWQEVKTARQTAAEDAGSKKD
jgi:MazG family protein